MASTVLIIPILCVIGSALLPRLPVKTDQELVVAYLEEGNFEKSTMALERMLE